jgi:hypothetical protein
VNPHSIYIWTIPHSQHHPRQQLNRAIGVFLSFHHSFYTEYLDILYRNAEFMSLDAPFKFGLERCNIGLLCHCGVYHSLLRKLKPRGLYSIALRFPIVECVKATIIAIPVGGHALARLPAKTERFRNDATVPNKNESAHQSPPAA